LWQYAFDQPKYSKLCIGRDWEVHQLHQLHTIVGKSHKNQTVCITGMSGSGKTCLLQSFSAQVHAANKRFLYCQFPDSSDQNPLNATHRLARILLGVPLNVADSFIRNKAAEVAITSLVFFLLLSLAGVTLTNAEQSALNGLNSIQQQEVETQVFRTLLKQCSKKNVSVIILDDVHLADDVCIRMVQTMANYCNDQPILLLLGITPINSFVHLPIWLRHAHNIKLRPLNEEDASSLAKVFMSCHQICPIKNSLRKCVAIQRAQGHPGLLEQLLLVAQPDLHLPEQFNNTIRAILYSLTSQQLLIIKFLAVSGIQFGADKISFFFLQKQVSNQFSQLHTLICLGLIKPTADEFCFNHVLIREVVNNQIKDRERQYLQTVCKEWDQMQVSRK
jgi:predicted ATPase